MSALRFILSGLVLATLVVTLTLESIVPAAAIRPSGGSAETEIGILGTTNATQLKQPQWVRDMVGTPKQTRTVEDSLRTEIAFRSAESRLGAALAASETSGLVVPAMTADDSISTRKIEHASWTDLVTGDREAMPEIKPLRQPASLSSLRSPYQEVSYAPKDLDIGCDPVACDTSCNPIEPWKLFGDDVCGWDIGGWASAGVYGNSRRNRNNGPLGFRDVGEELTVDQLWLYAEKTLDTRCGWDWGGRIDYLFGADGPDTQAFGNQSFDENWDSSPNYGSAMPQLYGEIGYGDLSVKFGHFYTIIGYEVVPAPDNFFYSHSYTMYYAEPFTHSGALATYGWNDAVTLYGGWTAGWDTGFTNQNNASTFLGGVSVDVNDCLSLAYAVNAGDFGSTEGDIYMHSLVAQMQLTDRLTWILQHDLGSQTGANGAVADRTWGGINQYLLYTLNPCWAGGLRFEWFNDESGMRVDGAGDATGDYYELTAGLNWSPRANLTVRPELRYDWFQGSASAGNLPFDSGTKSDQVSGGFDVILTF